MLQQFSLYHHRRLKRGRWDDLESLQPSYSGRHLLSRIPCFVRGYTITNTFSVPYQRIDWTIYLRGLRKKWKSFAIYQNLSYNAARLNDCQPLFLLSSIPNLSDFEDGRSHSCLLMGLDFQSQSHLIFYSFQLSMAPLICTSLLCSFEVSSGSFPCLLVPRLVGGVCRVSVVITVRLPLGMYLPRLHCRWRQTMAVGWSQGPAADALLPVVRNAVSASWRKSTHLARFAVGGFGGKKLSNWTNLLENWSQSEGIIMKLYSLLLMDTCWYLRNTW